MFLFETEHRRLRFLAYENKTNLPEFTVIQHTPFAWSLLPMGQIMYEVREDKTAHVAWTRTLAFSKTEQNGTNGQIPRARVRGKNGT